MKTLLAILILWATPVWGQALPDKPKPAYKDWQFWGSHALMFGAVAADATTTCQGFHRGLVEGGALGYGSHNCRNTILILSGAAAGYTGLNYFEWRMVGRESKGAWRVVARWTIPVIVGAYHGYGAAHNASIR